MTAQDFVVFAIVLAAVLYLGRGLVQSATGGKSCGGCSSGKKCGSRTSTNGNVKPAGSEQLIQIGLGSSFTGGRNGHAGTNGIQRRENTITHQ